MEMSVRFVFKLVLSSWLFFMFSNKVFLYKNNRNHTKNEKNIRTTTKGGRARKGHNNQRADQGKGMTTKGGRARKGHDDQRRWPTKARAWQPKKGADQAKVHDNQRGPSKDIPYCATIGFLLVFLIVLLIKKTLMNNKEKLRKTKRKPIGTQ